MRTPINWISLDEDSNELHVRLASLNSSSLNNWLRVRSIARSDKGVGTLSALPAGRREHWVALDAFGASAAVERPGVAVLRDCEPANGMTIAAGIKVNIREASGSSLERAAVRDLGDPGDVIELEVPLLVEGGIAHWRRRRIARDACRHLVVNVKVLSAALFLLAGNKTTMLCEDLCSIVVALVDAISKEILARLSASAMAINHHSVRHTHNVWPHTVVVDLKADCVAVLVIFLTGLIDASLAAALGQKLLLRVVVEEDVNIAFDLLGCRPIDLAILLQAFLLEDELLIPGPASGTALLILDIASDLLAPVLLTHALLKALLDRIT
jgi:hypothetical protein